MADVIPIAKASASNGSTRREVMLPGCAPTPLASYLKGLGVLRLVAEQADPDARGYWLNGAFALRSSMTGDSLCEFFLNRYNPTPVIAPWNGGSGFYPKDNDSGIRPIEKGSAHRFGAFRVAIETSRAVLQRLGFHEKPGADEKPILLRALRAELDDRALEWLDAAVLLTEAIPHYPPLLGTGGNDGRLDFTNNFMQRLVMLIDPDEGGPKPNASELLVSSLFDAAMPGLIAAAIGQFSPGSAGGPNAGTGFSAGSLINPWDFILMLEGALLFAAAATRRLESSGTGALSYPFTVRTTGSGAGAAAIGDEEKARHEIWLPLWERPSSLLELRVLLAEGRVTLGRRAARDGLDFVRAVSRLGVQRGITSFQRYGFLMRSGKAYLATPLDRIVVQRNPSADLVNELDKNRWLSAFRQLARGQNATNKIQSLVRRLEDAIFDLSRESDTPPQSLQRLLIVLGEAQLYLARSAKAREKCLPIPQLSSQWLEKAQDRSPEFAIAAALAGLHARRSMEDGRTGFLMPLRVHLAPLKEKTHDVTWGNGTLEDNLITLLQRRLLKAVGLDLSDKPLFSSRTAPVSAVAAWLADDLHVEKIESLLPGLALVRIPGRQGSLPRKHPLPAAYRILKPFFCTDEQLRRIKLILTDQSLAIPPEIIRELATGAVNAALARALSRLRIYGVAASFRQLSSVGISGRRLLAALIVPVSDFELTKLLLGLRQPEEETESTV